MNEEPDQRVIWKIAHKVENVHEWQEIIVCNQKQTVYEKHKKESHDCLKTGEAKGWGSFGQTEGGYTRRWL